MFRLTSKVKIAAGLAAGALTLGAAGAYAAANANNNGTIPVSSLKTVTGGTAGTLTVMSTNGKTATLTIPATFSNLGQCVSFFAQHQDLVLQPAAGTPSTARISKNSHGKLISGIKTWCETRLTSAAKTDSTEATTPDATDAADAAETDTTTPPSHGHGHGHGKNSN
jgi:hypothetical protein